MALWLHGARAAGLLAARPVLPVTPGAWRLSPARLGWRRGPPAASPGSAKPRRGAQRLSTHTPHGRSLGLWGSCPRPCAGNAENPGR